MATEDANFKVEVTQSNFRGTIVLDELPTMVIIPSGASINVNAHVPRQSDVDKMNAIAWCKQAVEPVGGTAGGAKDGKKGQGRVRLNDVGTVATIKAKAIELAQVYTE